MHRAALAAPLFLVGALALAGCGTIGGDATVPATVRAPPQTARLGWAEPYPAEAPALVFGVSSFTVTPSGWTADISVENRSDVGWEVGGARHEAALQFGVMLFPNDDLDELQRRNRDLDLPTLRAATSYRPALPVVLKPGTTWSGVISAPGALAGDLWVRMAFGPFTSAGKPPKGTASPVQWFTDHAYHLEEVAAVPA